MIRFIKNKDSGMISVKFGEETLEGVTNIRVETPQSGKLATIYITVHVKSFILELPEDV